MASELVIELMQIVNDHRVEVETQKPADAWNTTSAKIAAALQKQQKLRVMQRGSLALADVQYEEQLAVTIYTSYMTGAATKSEADNHVFRKQWLQAAVDDAKTLMRLVRNDRD